MLASSQDPCLVDFAKFFRDIGLCDAVYTWGIDSTYRVYRSPARLAPEAPRAWPEKRSAAGYSRARRLPVSTGWVAADISTWNSVLRL
jgi:hypothetical protein